MQKKYKKYLTCFIIFLFSTGIFSMDRGTIVLDHYECKSSDHIVISTRKGFTLAEVYSGYSETYEGDTIYGDLHSYGFTDIFDEDGDEIGRLYIDDYMADEDDAMEWCYRK